MPKLQPVRAERKGSRDKGRVPPDKERSADKMRLLDKIKTELWYQFPWIALFGSFMVMVPGITIIFNNL
jgi:hypothetical protein